MAQACSKFPHVYEAPAPGLTGFCQVICPQPGNLQVCLKILNYKNGTTRGLSAAPLGLKGKILFSILSKNQNLFLHFFFLSHVVTSIL